VRINPQIFCKVYLSFQCALCHLLSSCHVWWYNVFHLGLLLCFYQYCGESRCYDASVAISLFGIFCVLFPCHLVFRNSMSLSGDFGLAWETLYRYVAFLHISSKIFFSFGYANRAAAVAVLYNSIPQYYFSSIQLFIVLYTILFMDIIVLFLIMLLSCLLIPCLCCCGCFCSMSFVVAEIIFISAFAFLLFIFVFLRPCLLCSMVWKISSAVNKRILAQYQESV